MKTRSNGTIGLSSPLAIADPATRRAILEIQDNLKSLTQQIALLGAIQGGTNPANAGGGMIVPDGFSNQANVRSSKSPEIVSLAVDAVYDNSLRCRWYYEHIVEDVWTRGTGEDSYIYVARPSELQRKQCDGKTLTFPATESNPSGWSAEVEWKNQQERLMWYTLDGSEYSFTEYITPPYLAMESNPDAYCVIQVMKLPSPITLDGHLCTYVDVNSAGRYWGNFQMPTSPEPPPEGGLTLSRLTPMPVGLTGSSGDGTEASPWNHVHAADPNAGFPPWPPRIVTELPAIPESGMDCVFWTSAGGSGDDQVWWCWQGDTVWRAGYKWTNKTGEVGS